VTQDKRWMFGSWHPVVNIMKVCVAKAAGSDFYRISPAPNSGIGTSSIRKGVLLS